MASLTLDPNFKQVIGGKSTTTGVALSISAVPVTASVTGLAVAILDGSGSQITTFGGGTQYAEGATTSPGTGTLALGRYNATPPSLSDTALSGLQLDSAGNLKVTGSLSVGGTTDNSAFTAGSGTGTPTMAFYHSTIDTVTDGRSAVVGMTAKRGLFVNLQSSAGAETGVAGLPLQVSLANTGANATAVKVDNSAVTQPISQASPSTIFAFVTAVTTAGTRVQLASHAVSGGVLQAPSTNTGKIYVGDSNVSSTVYGAELQPGQATGVSLNNTNLIYIDSSVNGEKCAFLAS